MERLDSKLNNRRRVARKVIEQVEKGEKANIGKAMREVGYKPTTADCKTKEVRNSKEFKGEIESFTDQLEDLIQNNITHAQKKQAKASFRDSIEAVDKLKKLQREVDGLKTEGTMTIKWEVDN